MSVSNINRSLLFITAPIAALLGLGMGLVVPNNPNFWDALNAALPAHPDPRVVVVGIDDQTLSDYGRLSNWDRSLYARALDTLNTAGAKVVGIDILLDTPAPGDDALAASIGGRKNIVLAATSQQPEAAQRWNTSSGVSGLERLGNVIGAKFSYFQTAYEGAGGKLWPTISAQVTQQTGQTITLDTTPRLLRYPAEPIPVLPFRDLLSGNTRFSELQNKVVLLGVTASGIPGNALLDSKFNAIPGVVMQARAVSSLLQPPYTPLPKNVVTLLCVLVSLLTVTLRGYWGFALALGAVLLGVVGFRVHLLLPAVTLSLVAVVASSLVVAERYWLSRQLQQQDPLTGLGNRLAFTRAVELRWATRDSRPLGLLLLDLNQFHQVNELYGRQAGNELLKHLASTLRAGRSRRELVFRWGADEFALLLESATPAELAALALHIQASLAGLKWRDLPLSISIGKSMSDGLENASDLIERASRDRYRMKYQAGEGGAPLL